MGLLFNRNTTYMLHQWIYAILGLVIAAVPFLALTAEALTWTLVVLGLLITAVSLWSMFAEPGRGRMSH